MTFEEKVLEINRKMAEIFASSDFPYESYYENLEDYADTSVNPDLYRVSQIFWFLAICIKQGRESQKIDLCIKKAEQIIKLVKEAKSLYKKYPGSKALRRTGEVIHFDNGCLRFHEVPVAICDKVENRKRLPITSLEVSRMLRDCKVRIKKHPRYKQV